LPLIYERQNTNNLYYKMQSNHVTTESEERRENIEVRRKIRTYQKTLKHTLATTRFNNFTWEENCKMRNKNTTAKCIYAVPIQITSRIVLDSNIFVLEMNNDQNKIMGIGLIKNHPVAGKYSVHSVQNYNRFVYIGKWRIDREDMTVNELEILRLLEAVCFRGINHSKRGQGITGLPMKIQYKAHILGYNLIDYICDMFKVRMNKISK
jgi:hypothetical protein